MIGYRNIRRQLDKQPLEHRVLSTDGWSNTCATMKYEVREVPGVSIIDRPIEYRGEISLAKRVVDGTGDLPVEFIKSEIARSFHNLLYEEVRTKLKHILYEAKLGYKQGTIRMIEELLEDLEG